MDILLLLSVLLSCVAMMLTAKLACKFINKNISKNIKVCQVTPLKLVLILHAFAAVYVVVLSLVLIYMSKIEFYEKISKYVDGFILETFEDYTYDFFALPFSLLIMSIIVVLVSSFAIRMPCLLKRWNRSPNSN